MAIVTTIRNTPLVRSEVKLPRATIEFSGVSKTFVRKDRTSFVALSDFSTTINEGEFVSIVGPSGCGKSTLLRLAAGLMEPSSGIVNVLGKPMVEPRRNIGLVFQKPTLLPWLSARDNILFPVKHTSGRVDAPTRSRADELLSMIGLQEFANHRPDELSGGMQQRIGIARSLLHNPDILLMDEPFSALDALTRDRLSLDLLALLVRQPKTVIFITHSIQEAVLLSDRIVLMTKRPGRLLEVLDVNLPRPRSMDTLVHPEFGTLSNKIRHKMFALEGEE